MSVLKANAPPLTGEMGNFEGHSWGAEMQLPLESEIPDLVDSLAEFGDNLEPLKTDKQNLPNILNERKEVQELGSLLGRWPQLATVLGDGICAQGNPYCEIMPTTNCSNHKRKFNEFMEV